jgi:hypothetical protein
MDALFKVVIKLLPAGHILPPYARAVHASDGDNANSNVKLYDVCENECTLFYNHLHHPSTRFRRTQGDADKCGTCNTPRWEYGKKDKDGKRERHPAKVNTIYS